MGLSYFFDTYALVEIIKGNKNYDRYKDVKILLTKLNLMELYNSLLRDFNERVADFYYKFYSKYSINFDDDLLKEAVKFRLEFIKRNKFRISYVDAIGYILAKRLNVKFLTGDNQFKNLPNVEFMK